MPLPIRRWHTPAGTLVGNTLTVGDSGTAIVCTYTNSGVLSADLAITKTNNGTQLVRGGR